MVVKNKFENMNNRKEKVSFNYVTNPMKKILTLVLVVAGLASAAQTTSVERTIFQQQVSRTPHVIWEWVDADSTRAYQDTIPGITRIFHKDNEPGFRMEYVAYYYDLEPLYNDEIADVLVNDWLSFDLDSMYYARYLKEYVKGATADLLQRNFRKNYGVKWKEPYVVDSLTVSMEQVMLYTDTLNSGEIIMIMSYMRLMEDSASMGYGDDSGGLYDFMEMDESEMFGVLPQYDFSGEWLGRVHNVLYDSASFDVISYTTMDSMLVVQFPELSGPTLREVKPVKVYNEGALPGDWSTVFEMSPDSLMLVKASYDNPSWAHEAKLIWVDLDTLKYIIQVSDVANEAMGNEIPEGQKFAWVWEFARIRATKGE